MSLGTTVSYAGRLGCVSRRGEVTVKRKVCVGLVHLWVVWTHTSRLPGAVGKITPHLWLETPEIHAHSSGGQRLETEVLAGLRSCGA